MVGFLNLSWVIFTYFFVFQLLVLAKRFYLTGDMMYLYPFIQGSLESPFKGLFSADASLCNQYKYIAFNIFSWRILIISYKMLIITGISDEKTKQLTICGKLCPNSKRHNILPTRASFFISSAGKIESVQEFKIKIFEQLFHCRWQPCKTCMATCSSFQRALCFTFLR